MLQATAPANFDLTKPFRVVGNNVVEATTLNGNVEVQQSQGPMKLQSKNGKVAAHAIDRALRRRAKQEAKSLNAARRLWEAAMPRSLSLKEMLDVCRECHELSPFTFNNGNTFAAIGRTLIEEWTKSLSPVEAQIVQTAVGKVGVYICYDRHFPEGARCLGLNGAEIVFNPSATVAGLSQYLWKLEQPAHAVANQYFVGASNRVGVEAPWSCGPPRSSTLSTSEAPSRTVASRRVEPPRPPTRKASGSSGSPR